MEADFVGEVADIYKCIVCHLVLKDPIMIIDCGHRLCKHCFQSIKDYATKHGNPLLCPHDRKEVDAEKVVDDRGVARTVLDLIVFCNRKSEGCTWSGELRLLDDHVDQDCSVTALKRFMDTVVKRLDEKDAQVKELKEMLSSKEEVLSLMRNDCDNRVAAIDQRLKEVEGRLHRKDEEFALLKYEISGLRLQLARDTVPEERNAPMMKKRKTRCDNKENKNTRNEMVVEECEDKQSEERILKTTTTGKQIGEHINALKQENKELDEKLTLLEFKLACTNKELFQVKSSNLFESVHINAKRQGLPPNQLQNNSKPECFPDCFHCNEIKCLQRRLMNVSQYIPHERTKFVWKLKNYTFHEKQGGSVESPQFYCSLFGQCVRLYLRWGQDKSISLYFQLLTGSIQPEQPFDMKIQFEVADANGHVHNHTLSRQLNRSLHIKPGNSESTGIGVPSFLRYPLSKHYIVNDTLTITCDLSFDD